MTRARGPCQAWRHAAIVALGLAAPLVAPRRAGAEPPPEITEEDAASEGPEAGARRPAAPDTRIGHILVNAGIDVTAPVGLLSPTAVTSDLTGTGLSIGGRIGVGISRAVAVEATGAYSWFSGASDCTTPCRLQGFELGIGLSYHLAQGVAIDPWGSYGIGLRSGALNIPTSTAGTGDKSRTEGVYRGFDFAKIALGADFYPVPALGLGPYIEADIGSAFAHPEPLTTGFLSTLTTPPSFAAYTFIHIGLRIALDPLRSGSPRSRTATALR